MITTTTTTQDLRQWKSWGEVYRLYMASLDTQDKSTGEEKSLDPKKKRRRSRKSRWGQEPEEKKQQPTEEKQQQPTEEKKQQKQPDTSSEVEEPPTKKRKRKSRWGKETSQSAALASFMSPDQMKLMQHRMRLSTLEAELAELKDDSTKRDELIKEKEALNREISVLAMKTTNYASGRQFVRKLYAPVKEYPDYNFMGLLIGPRGNTHRKMEAETNCKIAIRGKGSAKSISNADQEETLHVIITGTNLEQVEKAEAMIAELLVPVDDTKNSHKMRQLRELAIYNGTFREDNYCSICGEKGHKQFECPNRQQTQNKIFEVRCSICGGFGHLTSDCKGKNNTEQTKMEEDYLNFMAEMGQPVNTDLPSTATSSSSSSSVPTVPSTTNVPSTTTPSTSSNVPKAAMITANGEKDSTITASTTPTPTWQTGAYVPPPPQPMPWNAVPRYLHPPPYGMYPPQMQYMPPPPSHAFGQQQYPYQNYAPYPPYGQQYPPPQQYGGGGANNYSAQPPPPPPPPPSSTSTSK